jgi:hypothetical protein
MQSSTAEDTKTEQNYSIYERPSNGNNLSMDYHNSLLYHRNNQKMKIYILFQGYRNNSNGLPIAAFRTKKQLRKWVKDNYPDYKGVGRVDPNEMYWQEEFYWLKCEDETIKVI